MIDFGSCLAECSTIPTSSTPKSWAGIPTGPANSEAASSVAFYRDTVVYSGNAVGKDYVVAGIKPRG